VPPGAKGLGFKNGTCGLVLRKAIAGLAVPPGAKVFVKVGEPRASAEFAVGCGELRRELGLCSPPTQIVLVRLSIDWPGLAKARDPKWAAGVAQRLGTWAGQPCPALVQEWFEARTAAEESKTERGILCGFELLKVLLFRKFAGCADTNPRNLLCRGETCLSVDETPAPLPLSPL
jgi:hypothetical protein